MTRDSTHTWLRPSEGESTSSASSTVPAPYEGASRITASAHEPGGSKNANDNRQDCSTEALPTSGLIKLYGLNTKERESWVLPEDFRGVPLNRRERAELTLEEILRIGVSVSGILAGIHAANMIHAHISPSTIAIDPETGETVVIDFESLTTLSPGSETLTNAARRNRNLPYMSPEQTGRMNRSVDYRTDFYSFGATLYELLTGRPPFGTSDALELIHYHIARTPEAPHSIRSEVPEVVSDIVMKLLAKNVEDRYQSAKGIEADLEVCLRRFLEEGSITPFLLGRNDGPRTLKLPQKLYNRDADIESLFQALDRAFQGKNELLLVAGQPGIGKTSLVTEIFKRASGHRGYMAAGKFHQLQHSTPYSAVVQAFRSLTVRLLTEDPQQFALSQERLCTALAANGGVIIDVIPEVKLIVGDLPPVPELGPIESRNRFRAAFQEFIRVFCWPEHPLVIFLDDLQWADSSSIDLLKLMMADEEMRGLLVIGAYRDTEVDPDHPLTRVIRELEKQGVAVNEMVLEPLSLNHVGQLLCDGLEIDPASVTPLAELVLRRTGGNPFFINEFLMALHAEELLRFENSRGVWQWDLDSIEERGIGGNVVELMAARMKRMSAMTRTVLKMAACIGSHFDLATLATACNRAQTETAESLAEAVAHGLVVALDRHENTREIGTRDLDDRPTIEYKFVHDGIQQAAYSLISEQERFAVHRRLGLLLLQHTPPERQQARIFEITGQLNRGQNLIETAGERYQLARLNLAAGKKATATVAYQLALQYLRSGIQLLDKESWEEEYSLTLELHVETAAAAYINGEFSEMERLAADVLTQARTLLDKVRVHEVGIQALIAQNRMVEAVQRALEVLKVLGIHFPEQVRKIHLLMGLLRTKLALKRHRIEDLVNLPEMTDPVKLAAMRILATVCSAAYFVATDLLPLVVFTMVRLSVKYGNAPISPYAYACHAVIMSGHVGDLEAGYQFGQLALNLLEHSKAEQLRSRTLLVVTNFARHWKRHIRETTQPLQEAYQSGLKTGDFEFASLSPFLESYFLYFLGTELFALDRIMATHEDAIRQLKQDRSLFMHQVYRQVVDNLRGKSDNACRLMGQHYDEEEMLPKHVSANDRTTICHVFSNKSILCYLFDQYHDAVQWSTMAQSYLDGLTGTLSVPISYFYDSLARLAIFASSPRSQQRHILKTVAANQKKLKRFARYAPMNHLHKFYLVEAEWARVLAKDSRARTCYEQAVAISESEGYLNEHALANELAAKFLISRGDLAGAASYLKNARQSYVKWGATAKVNDLDQRYRWLFVQGLTEVGTEAKKETPPAAGSRDYFEAGLDLRTVMKAAQAISSEIVLDKLLTKLMHIIMENAGAQRGFLIMESDKGLVAEVHGSSVEGTVRTLNSMPLEECSGLSQRIVNYVARTGESLVLNDAMKEGDFTADPYVLRMEPKSIICTPLVHQGKAVGILYLENNLTAFAFTPARTELLRLLCSQAAISLENARFYEQREHYLRTLEKTALAQQQSELRYRTIIEHMGDGYYEVDLKGDLVFFNDSICNITGYTREELTGMNYRALMDEVTVKKAHDTFHDVFETGQPTQSSGWEFVRRDGSRRIVESSISLMLDSSGQPCGFRGVGRDVTNRKRDEAELLKLEKLESLGILAGGIAHDFNNILTCIAGKLSVARILFRNNEKLDRLLVQAEMAATRAQDLTHQLLTFSKGGAPVRKTALIGEVITESCQFSSTGGNIRWEFSVPDNLSPVEIDESQISQVISNLAINAMQAMPDGGVVSVKARDVLLESGDVPTLPAGKYVSVSIQDRGCGIPGEQLQKIFDPYFTTKADGSGLGLASVHSIVRSHGGSVRVESEVGVGSAFSVFLPASDKPGHASDKKKDQPAVGQGRILVMDDEEVIRELAAELLSLLGYEVVTTEDGAEAVDLYQSAMQAGQGFDVVVMDLTVRGGMGGVETIRRLREIDPSVTAIVSSGYSNAPVMANYRQYGFSGVCPKPYNAEVISKVIQQACLESRQ